MRAVNLRAKTVLAEQVIVADNFFKRLKGLMGTQELKGKGMLLKNCQSIHTCFMKYPIDVVYLDGDDKVLKIAEAIQPYRLGPVVRGCTSVLELPAGACRATGTCIDDTLEFF